MVGRVKIHSQLTADVVVGDAETAPEYAVAITTQGLSEETLEVRRPRQCDRRSKIVPILRIEAGLLIKLASLVESDGRVVRSTKARARDANIEKVTQRCRGNDFESLPFIDRSRCSPTQAIRHGKVLLHSPAVLQIQIIFLSRETSLRAKAGRSDLPTRVILKIGGV